VIEVVTGKSLDEFLAQTIFQPLDMKDTAFSVPAEKLDRFAANYSRTNGLTVIDAPADSKYAGNVTFFSGGGGLVSTARDYLRFLAMIERGGTLDGHRILRSRTAKLMSSNLLPEKAFRYISERKAFGHRLRPRVFGLHGSHELGSGGAGRRIRLGRCGLHSLLGQPGGQTDRGDAGTNHALPMGHRTRRQENHLRRDSEMKWPACRETLPDPALIFLSHF